MRQLGEAFTDDYKKLLDQLGAFKKDTFDESLEFVAQGAAGTIRLLNAKFMGDGYKIIGFERRVGQRIYDVVLSPPVPEILVETKSWRGLFVARQRLEHALSLTTKKNGDYGAPGQLVKDIVATIRKKDGGGEIHWEFSDAELASEAGRAEMIKTVMDKIKKDKELQRYFVRNLDWEEYSQKEVGEIARAVAVLLGGVK